MRGSQIVRGMNRLLTRSQGRMSLGLGLGIPPGGRLREPDGDAPGARGREDGGQLKFGGVVDQGGEGARGGRYEVEATGVCRDPVEPEDDGLAASGGRGW